MEADLQRYYGVDLADMYRGEITVRKVAVFVLNLPRGAQTWIAVGGPGAVTEEVEAGWIIEHTLLSIAYAQGGSKGQAPKFRPYPDGILEAEKKAEVAHSRAAAFRAKHGKDN